jgi:hypothetical protein
MKSFYRLPLGCFTALLLAIIVWVALQFVLLPSLEKEANREGHKFKDYINRLFYGR